MCRIWDFFYFSKLTSAMFWNLIMNWCHSQFIVTTVTAWLKEHVHCRSNGEQAVWEVPMGKHSAGGRLPGSLGSGQNISLNAVRQMSLALERCLPRAEWHFLRTIWDCSDIEKLFLPPWCFAVPSLPPVSPSLQPVFSVFAAPFFPPANSPGADCCVNCFLFLSQVKKTPVIVPTPSSITTGSSVDASVIVNWQRMKKKRRADFFLLLNTYFIWNNI